MWKKLLKSRNRYMREANPGDWGNIADDISHENPHVKQKQPKITHGELAGKEGPLGLERGKKQLITLAQYNELDREGKTKSHSQRSMYYKKTGNIKLSNWHNKMYQRMRKNRKYIAPYNPRHEDTWVSARTRTVPKVEGDVPDIFGPQGEMRPFSQQMAHEKRKQTRKEKQAEVSRKWREEHRPWHTKYPRDWKEQLKERPKNYDKVKNIVALLDKAGKRVNQTTIREEFTHHPYWTVEDKVAIDYVLAERRGDN